MIYFTSLIYLAFMFFLSIRIKGGKAQVIYLSAGLLTLILCVFGVYFSLPFSGDDAIRFEKLAWDISKGSLSDIFNSIDLTRSYVISSITAFFYYFSGREPSFPIFINGVLGLFIMYYSLILYDEMWGRNSKGRIFYFLLVCFSPMLIINSAIILRENYVILFLILSSINLCVFLKNNNWIYAFKFFLFVLFASFFHGASFLYALGFPIFLLIFSDRFKVPVKILGAVFFTLAIVFLLEYLSFGKLEGVQESGLSVDTMSEKLENINQGSTTYLYSLQPKNAFDIVWQSPIRMLYFLTKPFIWDVKNFGHAIAFFDALIWFLIILTILKNRKLIYSNPSAVAVLICCTVAIFAFSYGTSNFGTALRHRTKFYVEMLVLAAPFFIGFKFKGNRG